MAELIVTLVALLVAFTALVALVVQGSSLRSGASVRQRLEAELRAAEASLADMLAIASDAIVTVDEEQRIIRFNRGAEKTFGYRADDVIGRSLEMLKPVRFRAPADAPAAVPAEAVEAVRRMSDRREIRGLRADGTEFPAEAWTSKLASDLGETCTLVLRDITPQRHAEENDRFLMGAVSALAHTHAFDDTARAIVDLPIPKLADISLLDVVVAAGPLLRVASTRHRPDLSAAMEAVANHRVTDDSPWPGIDAIRRNRSEVVDHIDAEWLDAHVDAAAVAGWRALGAQSMLFVPLSVAGETFGVLTLARVGPAGFDAEACALAEAYGAAAANALTMTRLREAAREASRSSDETLRMISHDLRNPLAAIGMCARAFRDAAELDATSRTELLTTILESTSSMNQLIEDLVDVRNIERGRLSLDVTLQEPALLVQRAAHQFAVDAAKVGITLETKTSSDLRLVPADGARILQVFGNLLRNAIQYTPRAGRIEIGVDGSDAEITFTVRDTGAGIRAEDQPFVFAQHWRVGQTAGPAPGNGGRGLGLTIAKGIVEAHGGRIWVESEPGLGSTVRFTIPQTDGAG